MVSFGAIRFDWRAISFRFGAIRLDFDGLSIDFSRLSINFDAIILRSLLRKGIGNDIAQLARIPANLRCRNTAA